MTFTEIQKANKRIHNTSNHISHELHYVAAWLMGGWLRGPSP